MSSKWQDVPLSEVCEFKYGKSLPSSERTGGTVPVFGSNGVVGQHNEAITAGPTIIVGRKGSFGEVNFSTEPCWPIDTTYYIDSTATTTDLRWLAYRIAALGLNKLNRAAAVPGLNREDAYRQRLLLPPLPEQRRIAEVLDRAEALRAKRRAALAQLDTLMQAIFLDMFGDPAINPKGWPKVALQEIAANITDGKHGDCRPSEASGYYFVSVKDIKNGEIDYSEARQIDPVEFQEVHQRTRLEPGDVLVTNSGTIGKTAIVGNHPNVSRTTFQKSVAIIKPKLDEVDSTFLKSALDFNVRHLATASSGSSQKNLLLGQMRRFQIVLPGITFQHEFARRVAAVDKLKTAHRASLAELDALFAALQHRAFRGEL